MNKAAVLAAFSVARDPEFDVSTSSASLHFSQGEGASGLWI